MTEETILYISFALLAAILIKIFFSIFIKYKTLSQKYAVKYSVLRISVPKDNESTPLVTEQIFATLQGIKSKFNFFEKLRGMSSHHISLEIANINKEINFYITTPTQLKNSIKNQIYAQYPEVEIAEIPDYSKTISSSKLVGTELKFTNSILLPIKRYGQFEDKINKTIIDPLASITASLLNLNNQGGGQIWLQIVITPVSTKERKKLYKGVKLLSKKALPKSKKLQAIYLGNKILPKIIFFPLWLILWSKATFSSNNDTEKSIDPSTSDSHDRETPAHAATDKINRPLFKATIRIAYATQENIKTAKNKIDEIVSTFKQFNAPHINGFEANNYLYGLELANRYRRRLITQELILSNEELATIYHLPNITVKTPSINWVKSRKLESPSHLPNPTTEKDVTTLGVTNYRDNKEIFGINKSDRQRHIYIIGKTGMGKSTLLENMIHSDINENRGVGVIDPHGDLAEAVLSFIPSNRVNDVVLIDPSDDAYAVSFNMLENVNPAFRSIVTSGLVGIFKKIYADSWGPRLEHILRNTILALLESPGTSMLGIPRILSDKDYRKKIVSKVQDPVVQSFWKEEFETWNDRQRTEAIAPIQNKVGQFLSSPTIRHIVGQNKSTIDLRFFMDKGKIVIINLSKGKIGEDNSSLLGAMFITKFQLDAMSRANIPEKDRKDFYLYVDEFQNFATESFATILSEARKYKLNLTMANQYIAQMPEEVKNAVFGNVGTLLTFQVGFDDADYISQQFGEEVLPGDLVSLNKYSGYMRLLKDGMPTKTFSLNTLPPPEVKATPEDIAKIIKVSRQRYSRETKEITEKIKRWSQAATPKTMNKEL